MLQQDKCNGMWKSCSCLAEAALLPVVCLFTWQPLGFISVSFHFISFRFISFYYFGHFLFMFDASFHFSHHELFDFCLQLNWMFQPFDRCRALACHAPTTLQPPLHYPPCLFNVRLLVLATHRGFLIAVDFLPLTQPHYLSTRGLTREKERDGWWEGERERRSVLGRGRGRCVSPSIRRFAHTNEQSAWLQLSSFID